MTSFLCCISFKISGDIEDSPSRSEKAEEKKSIFSSFLDHFDFPVISQTTNLDKMGNVRLVKFQWKGVGHLSEWSIPYGFDVARKEEKCGFLFLKQTITPHPHTLTTEFVTLLMKENRYKLYNGLIIAILFINLYFLLSHFNFFETRRSPVIESATLPLLSCGPAGKDLAKAGKIIAQRRAFHWLILRCQMQDENDQCSKCQQIDLELWSKILLTQNNDQMNPQVESPLI